MLNAFEALQFLSILLIGKTVRLMFDGYQIGDYDVRNTRMNAELIRRGFGHAGIAE